MCEGGLFSQHAYEITLTLQLDFQEAGYVAEPGVEYQPAVAPAPAYYGAAYYG